MLLCEIDKAGADVLADQVSSGGVLALLRHLDLQLAGAEAQFHDQIAAGRLQRVAAVGTDFEGGPARAVVRSDASVVLLHLVPARDAQVNLSFAYESGNVGRGEEDEGDGEVLDKGDVQAILAAELDVATLEEVESGSIEAALCDTKSV